ncbi:hypothetical protein QJQ45_021782 [Haematococcus lacustris]|nr:hypothetical protein QJQ45_021782 [Haematococcus lacustris]
MGKRHKQPQAAVDGGASATDGYSPAGEAPPPATRLLDLPPALLDDIACRVMQLQARSQLPLTCRAFSLARLLHVPALRIQLSRQRCNQWLTPRVAEALQARTKTLELTLHTWAKDDWYTGLLATCMAVDVCRLRACADRDLPPDLAQRLMDSFPGLTSLELYDFSFTSSGLASLLAHPRLFLQLQQLQLSCATFQQAQQPGVVTLGPFQGARLKHLGYHEKYSHPWASRPPLPDLQPLAQHLTQLHLMYELKKNEGPDFLVQRLRPLAQLKVLTLHRQYPLEGLIELLQVLPQLHTLQLPAVRILGQQQFDTLLAATQITSLQLRKVEALDTSYADAPCSWQRLELTEGISWKVLASLPLHSLSQPLVLHRLDICEKDISNPEVAAALHNLAYARKVPVKVKRMFTALSMKRGKGVGSAASDIGVTPASLQQQRVDLAQLVAMLQPLQCCDEVEVRGLHRATAADVAALAPLCRDCTHFALEDCSMEPSLEFWRQLVQLMPTLSSPPLLPPTPTLSHPLQAMGKRPSKALRAHLTALNSSPQAGHRHCPSGMKVAVGRAQAEVQRLRGVEQSLMGTVDGLQGDLDDLQAAHQRLQDEHTALQQVACKTAATNHSLRAARRSLLCQVHNYRHKRRPHHSPLTFKQRQQLLVLEQHPVSVEVLRRCAEAGYGRLDSHGRPMGSMAEQLSPAGLALSPTDIFIPGELPQTEYTQQYTDLLAHALAKLDKCAAVEVCKLVSSGTYNSDNCRHLHCSPGLAQHLLDSFPSLTALTLDGLVVSSDALASLLSHPPLALQLQQLDITDIISQEGDEPGAVGPVFQGLQLRQLSIAVVDAQQLLLGTPPLPIFQPLAHHLTQLNFYLYYPQYDDDPLSNNLVQFKYLVEYLQPLTQLQVLTLPCQDQLEGLTELLQALPQLHTLQVPAVTVSGHQQLDTLLAATQITSLQLDTIEGLGTSYADAPCSWQRLELTGGIDWKVITYLPLHSLSQPLLLGHLEVSVGDTPDPEMAAALQLLAYACKVPVQIKSMLLTMLSPKHQSNSDDGWSAKEEEDDEAKEGPGLVVITPAFLQQQRVELAQLVALLQPLQCCGKVVVHDLHGVIVHCAGTAPLLRCVTAAWSPR